MFYDTMGCYDLYVKYVKVLGTIHKKSRNLVCAAHTLKLHAQLLDWSCEQVQPHLQHLTTNNVIAHKDLKEMLFLDIINDFTEGQAWEKALEFSRILCKRYETQLEIEKLCGLLRKQVELCENIVKIKRYECNYCLVGYFGKDFPAFLQNKQFVFRTEFEHTFEFRTRAESWFPRAIRIANSKPVSEEEKNSNKQCN